MRPRYVFQYFAFDIIRPRHFFQYFALVIIRLRYVFQYLGPLRFHIFCSVHNASYSRFSMLCTWHIRSATIFCFWYNLSTSRFSIFYTDYIDKIPPCKQHENVWKRCAGNWLKSVWLIWNFPTSCICFFSQFVKTWEKTYGTLWFS